jgi:hypothetical protein
MRSRCEQQGATGPRPKVGDGAEAGKKWTLVARNLTRKKMAWIWEEGISKVEFFQRERAERMSGGAEGINIDDFLFEREQHSR